MKIYPQWDLQSLIIYIFLAVLGGLCAKKARNSRTIKIGNKRMCNAALLLWFLIWEFFACFRYIGWFVGGADAQAYKEYFVMCREKGIEVHFAEDILYRFLNQFVRIFTDDYHVFFFVVYAILLISYFSVLATYDKKILDAIPYYTLFYIFLRGFVTIRTNLSVAMILISLSFWKKENKKYSILFAIAAIFFQRAAVLYSFIILYLYLTEKRKISNLKCFIGVVMASAIGRIAQYIIGHVNISFLNTGAYKWYALYANENTTFFSGYWKVVLPEIFLAAVMLLMNKEIIRYENTADEEEQNRARLVRQICYFDFMTVPITYILNIWRGYEYLYIFRLIMWAEVLLILKNKMQRRDIKLFRGIVFLIFLGWMIFKINSTWEDSGLMPFRLQL